MRNKASTEASHECGIFFFIYLKEYDDNKILFQFHEAQRRLYVNASINIGSNGNGWIKLTIDHSPTLNLYAFEYNITER